MATTGESTRLEREVPGVGTIEFVETPKKREYWLLPEQASGGHGCRR